MEHDRASYVNTYKLYVRKHYGNVGICQHGGMTGSATLRHRYHHGDLRNALTEAAAGLAERGGPDAVTIRAAARAVGVTPTATYRHFANQAELLEAARSLAVDTMSRAMTVLLEAIPDEGDPVDLAVRRLEASGRGYVKYALENPGLFRTAFCRTPLDTRERDLSDAAPYALLSSLLDRLVEVGHLHPALRPAAEASAWSTVHGLALLMIEGPLSHLSPTEREAVIDRTVAMVHRGLAGGPNAR
jgi:AcrR family transcriptional regulator